MENESKLKWRKLKIIDINFLNEPDLVGTSKRSNCLRFFFGHTSKELITNAFPHERYVF